MSITFSYKANKDADSVNFNLPVSVDDFPVEQITRHASANMVVKAQGIIRAHRAKRAANKPSKLPRNNNEWVKALLLSTPKTPMEKLLATGLTKTEIEGLLETIS